MDSPVASAFLKHLLSHSFWRPQKRSVKQQTQRGLSTTPRARFNEQGDGPYSRLKKAAETGRSVSQYKEIEGTPWRPRQTYVPEEYISQLSNYDLITADQLRAKGRRPKRSRMAMREFIEDSLYNPAYGYFTSQATIFNPGTPFDFPTMKSGTDFNRTLDERYASFEDELDEQEPNDTRQLWHTPTELFRPHYAEAMARYLVENYRISLYPYNDLIIYELGAGNGTFMLNVLDYIRDTDPEVYARTKYKVVEISSSLAKLQAGHLTRTADSEGHSSKVEIINRSIFNWDIYVPAPCFVIALEVIDNFAHDVIRYDRKTGQPLQGMVMIDVQGELYEYFSPQLDEPTTRYLRLRDAAQDENESPAKKLERIGRTSRGWFDRRPLSQPEYIPTRLMGFFDVLQNYFPMHRLLLSDFDALPGAIEGINAPVVQTRFQRRPVSVSTPLVRQGYFDIFFPTNFEQMEGMYQALTGRLTRTSSHADFMRRWAFLEETATKNGENPLLDWYRNARVMTTL
ncbi:MAG: hypothetical protein M1828_002189 [Chrysothrix sp. TS-e1954]|nr:MAG: hypothetical protein M1828_002189 [Chrysothrix sp. TS-e1954]